MTAGTVIQFRRTPEIEAVLERLRLKTGMQNQSEVIRLAIMEMAERRGVAEEVTVEGKRVASKRRADTKRKK